MEFYKHSDGSITAKLSNIREDIIIEGVDFYTFYNDGKYTFFYKDFLGNDKYITATVSGLKYNFSN